MAAPPASSARWLLAAGALLALAALVWVLTSKPPSPPPPQVADAGPRSAAPRPPPPPSLAARPRAGVSGHVLDPDKKPIAGASVCAWPLAEGELTTAQARVPRCAASDKEGAYALTDLFPATPLTLSAAAEGFPPEGYRSPDASGPLRLAEGEQRPGVDFVMRSGGVKVQGRVNDATGGVVPGALVTLGRRDSPGRSIATSDSKGEFALWTEPGEVHLEAAASGYAPTSANGPAPGRFFTLTLVPGATLVGRVVLAGSETPVVGARVDALQVEGGGSRATARSDDEGRFRVEGLLPGRFRVEATSEGREGYSRSSVTLALGETSQEVVVEMDPAYIVRGRVLDKVSKKPCTAGQVVITDNKQNEFSQASIDLDGWARMASVIPGDYEVEVRCEGYLPGENYPQIVITNRDAPEQSWEVDPGASVRVSVVDSQRKPVTSARVMAFPKGRGHRASTERAEADGTFLVRGLSAGPHTAQVFTHDNVRASAEFTADPSREERLTIELPASGAIDGVVEDEAHHPVADVPVYASGPGRASARSLDDGTFTLPGLPSGEYVVHAGDDTARFSGVPQDTSKPSTAKVTVAAPGRARAKLIIGRRDGTIEGRVVDSHNQPVIDAFLEFLRVAPGERSRPGFGMSGRPPVVTDTEGHFKIESLSDGDYNLRAYQKGGGEALAEHVKVGTRDVTLKITQGASIAGTLTSPSGPVDRFDLRAVNETTHFRRHELFFHARGAFALRDLPPGPYEIVAELPEGVASAKVTLAEGEQKTDLRLTLAMRGVVRGRIVNVEGGAPVPGLRINLNGPSEHSVMSGEAMRKNLTGADGRFSLDGVLGGKWTLTIFAEDKAQSGFDGTGVPVEVRPDGPTDLGDIRVARSRLGNDDTPGTLGLGLNPPAGPDGPLPIEVVSSAGAAEEAGIKPGDVIVSIDGIDVRGSNRYLFSPLALVPVGRSLSIGLARGGTVTLVPR